MNQRSKAVIFFSDFGDDCVNLWQIVCRGQAACCVGHQFDCQTPRDLVFVLQKQTLQVVDISEGPAVGQNIGGIDLQALVVVHFPAIDGDFLGAPEPAG